MIVSSTFEQGPLEADGRRYVKEKHIAADGLVYDYEYLNDTLDPQLVMEERAAQINATLAAREAARIAVEGTSVPLSRFQFLSRFTAAERVSVRAAAKTDAVVDDFFDLMSQSAYVSLARARAGLVYLVSVGLLTQARSDEIGAE